MVRSMARFIGVGYGNSINVNQVSALLNYNGATARNTLRAAKDAKRWIDLTGGHKCRSLVILDDGHVAALGLSSDTILRRISDGITSDNDFQ